MSIERFFDKTFTVKRMVWSGDSSGEVSQTSITGHLQQAAPELLQSLGLAFTRAFSIWCAVGSNVEEGDTLTCSGETYSVKAVMVRDYGENQHLQLIVQKDDHD